MPDTQARIEALRWAALAAKYAVDDALHHEGIAAAESLRQRAAILTAMADELADTADDEAVAQRTADDATEWRSAEEFERALREAKP